MIKNHLKPNFVSVFAILFFSLILPVSAYAHAFGVRYDLPLPLSLYLGGAGAVVALSFLIMVLFFKMKPDGDEIFQYDIRKHAIFDIISAPIVLTIIKVISVLIFLLLVTAGLVGNPDPFENIAPVFVWVIWWVGMAFISALFGNVWDLINPWKSIFTWLRRLGNQSPKKINYPTWLGYWPAVFLFTIFAWLELISEQGEKPQNLALLIIIYSAVTWLGMLCFGRDKWLHKAEIFTIVFSLLASFAPFNGHAGKWYIRFPASGLLIWAPVSPSKIYFILLLLASVTFDGILETPLWEMILTWIAENQMLRSTLITLQNAGFDLVNVIKTLALIALPFFFVAVFLITSKAINWASGGQFRTLDIAGYFALSLVPIAIAYHLSHYLSYLLIAGQNIIPLVSDPFGWGWNLFGTSTYAVDIGIVNAKVIWYVSVISIVAGHVWAVFIAHVMAGRVMSDTQSVIRSQIPMLVLMVSYTMLSLWILSQPIIT